MKKSDLIRILDVVPFGAHFYELNADGRLVFIGANRTADSILNIDNNKFVGMTIEEAFPALASTNIPDTYRRVAANGEQYNDEHIEYNDQEIAGAFEVHAVQTAQNHMVVFFSDIRERKESERRVIESEARYRNVVDNMTECVFSGLVDEDMLASRLTLVSKQIERMTGYTPEEFLKNQNLWFQIIHQEDIPTVRESTRKSLTENVTVTRNYRLKHKLTGEYIWIEDTLVPQRDNSGRVVAFFGTARDISESKRSEEVVKTQREFLRSVIDLNPNLIFAKDWDGKFILANKAVADIYGTTVENLLGKGDADFNPKQKEVEHYLRDDREVMESGQPKFIAEESVSNSETGEVRWFQTTKVPLVSQDGIARQVLGVSTDITERKRAEQLQIAVYKIAQATDEAPNLEGLFRSVHEIIGTVMPANNFFLTLYDDKTDVMTFPYFVDEVDVPPQPGTAGRGLTAYVLRTGKSLLCDIATDEELRRRGEVELVGVQSPIWLGVPLKMGNKTIGAMVVQHYSDPNAYGERELRMLEYVSSQVARAIEHKQSEEKIRQSEEQFRLITENVADMIAVLDLEGRRIYNSPSYREILGDTEALRGTDSFNEIHPDDREKVKQIFLETVRTGIGRRAEYRFVTKNGHTRSIESQGSVIRDQAGKPFQVIVVSRDVTEKKNLEQQFLRAQRMESIGTLAGGIAHDLNNILSPILLSIDMFRTLHPDAASKKILDTIEASANRGANLVKQVLSFARGVEGERTAVQVRHLVTEVEKIITQTFPKNIAVSTEMPKNLWLISGDATQLHQVLMNLSVNARDAMPDGGRIDIKGENVVLDEQYARMNLGTKLGSYVVISVTDTGIGIEPEVLDKIFEPFFTTKVIGKGTGLGLSTVLGIVRSHGGFVNVYSELGRGTTFRVYLPALGKGTLAETKPEAVAIMNGNGELILVVDDEPDVREITKATLEAYGYRVVTANDGTEAIAIYSQHQNNIGAVITDMMMPFMDGTATIRALRKMDPKLKIIAVSGLMRTEAKGTVEEEESVAFLHKPYTSEKLLSTLYKVMHE